MIMYNNSTSTSQQKGVGANPSAFDQLRVCGPGAESLEAIDIWWFKTILIRF